MIPVTTRAGIALALISAAGFGSSGLFAGMAYRTGATTWQLLTARFLIACACLVLLGAFRRGTAAPAIRSLGLALLLGVTAYSLQAYLYFSAIRQIGAGLSAILLYLYPALVCLAIWLLEKKPPGRLQAFSIGLAFAGTTLISVDGAGRLDVAGIACAAGAAVVYTGYLMSSARLLRTLDPNQAATLIFLGACVSFLAAAPLQPRPLFPALLEFWIAAAGLALLCTILPVLTMFAAIQRIGVTRTSLLSTIEPVVALVLGYLFLQERFDVLQGAGAGLVLLSILILEGFKASQPASVT